MILKISTMGEVMESVTEDVLSSSANGRENVPVKRANLLRSMEIVKTLAERTGVDLTPREPFLRCAELLARYRAWKFGGKPKPSVGLCFYGPCGTGKTRIAEFFREVVKAATGHPIIFLRTKRLIDDFQFGDGRSYYSNRYGKSDIILDDLGRERTGNSFGRLWGMEDFIDDRYAESFRRYGVLTIATTNMNGMDEIGDRYGEAIRSRCAEMFDFVKVDTDDRRDHFAEARKMISDALWKEVENANV